jgi:hypothetical protein
MLNESQNNQVKPLAPQKLHKIVFSLLGVFTLMALSYPVAMFRVSQMDKFQPYNFHVKSLTPDYKQVQAISQK